jgi:hypothetical protein
VGRKGSFVIIGRVTESQIYYCSYSYIVKTTTGLYQICLWNVYCFQEHIVIAVVVVAGLIRKHSHW